MNAKLIIFFILSLIAGIAFMIAGIYFLSDRFISKLNDSSPDRSPETQAKNLFRSKGCGMTTFVLGFLTIIFSFFLFMFPFLVSTLALIYMILLIVAFAVIMLVFK